MVNTIATVLFLVIWLAAAVADLWISSLATLRLYRDLRRRATPAVLGGLLSALAWIGLFSLGWPFVGLWWAVRKLSRQHLADGHADG
jgi:hypothetical protein